LDEVLKNDHSNENLKGKQDVINSINTECNVNGEFYFVVLISYVIDYSPV